MMAEDARMLAEDAGRPRASSSATSTPELVAVPHCEMPHPPATPLSQESDRPPLLPSSYHPMGSGLADHDLAVAETAWNELWMWDSNFSWEDREIMRGLGINGPHHVSCSISVQEMKSRAYGRAYAEVLRKRGAHTRLTEDGVDDDASCSSIEIFGAVSGSGAVS